MSRIKDALDDTFRTPAFVAHIQHAKEHAEQSGGFDWQVFRDCMTGDFNDARCADFYCAAGDAIEAAWGEDWLEAFYETLEDYLETYLPILTDSAA